MENKYIYIDESGDTGYTKKSTRYFILTAVIVDDSFILRRLAKNVYKYKVDKKKTNSIHSYKETNRIKNKIIKEINNIEIKCIVFVLDKKEKNTKDPYKYLLERLVSYFSNQKNYQVILARRDTRKSYNKNIIDLFKKYNISLCFSDPTSEKALQIADFYSFTVFCYLEKNDGEFFNRIKDKILFI